MSWKVGSTYNTPSGKKLKVLEVDAPVPAAYRSSITYVHRPILTMGEDGDLHFHFPNGRVWPKGTSDWDLIMPTQKLEAFVCVKVAAGQKPRWGSFWTAEQMEIQVANVKKLKEYGWIFLPLSLEVPLP